MAIIHELSPHLADLIAAGEVVERPASVAKELIENAIDAGSTRITVEIENGGITYLRIADNGCGMSAEDAPVAFRRHATSKLRTEEDLAAIGTLGFRGEALAAISSVTRIDLFTRQTGAIAGLHLHLEAGEIQTNEEAGCPEGTTIVVRDLFYNTPARMKFLKKDFTEAGYILGVVQHAALSHPEIAFTLIRDGKQVFATDGRDKLLTPVFAVFGKEMTANMIEVPRTERNGMTAYGYIVKPHAGRPNRSMQHFFVKRALCQKPSDAGGARRGLPQCHHHGQIPLRRGVPRAAAFGGGRQRASGQDRGQIFAGKTGVRGDICGVQERACGERQHAAHRTQGKSSAPGAGGRNGIRQERFAVARPAEPASPAKPAPGPADNVPDLEDFFVAVPPRAERPRGYGSYAAAPRILQDEPQRLFHPVEKPLRNRSQCRIRRLPSLLHRRRTSRRPSSTSWSRWTPGRA